MAGRVRGHGGTRPVARGARPSRPPDGRGRRRGRRRLRRARGLQLVQPPDGAALHGAPRPPALGRARPLRGRRLLRPRARHARGGPAAREPGPRRLPGARRRVRRRGRLPPGARGRLRRARGSASRRVRGGVVRPAAEGPTRPRRAQRDPAPGGGRARGQLGGRRGPGLGVPVLQLRAQGRVLQEQAKGRGRGHRTRDPVVHARLDRALHGAELAGAPVDAQQSGEPPARQNGVLHRAGRRARGLPSRVRPRGDHLLRPGVRLRPHPGLRLPAADGDVPRARLARPRHRPLHPGEESLRLRDRPARCADRPDGPVHGGARPRPPLALPRRRGRRTRSAEHPDRPRRTRPRQCVAREAPAPRRPRAPWGDRLPVRALPRRHGRTQGRAHAFPLG